MTCQTARLLWDDVFKLKKNRVRVCPPSAEIITWLRQHREVQLINYASCTELMSSSRALVLTSLYTLYDFDRDD